MNDPQTWTLIGVISALIFASNRQLSTSIRREFEARFDQLDAKIDGLDRSINAKMGARFADVEHRLDSLEGDMHLIKAHLIGESGATRARG